MRRLKFLVLAVIGLLCSMSMNAHFFEVDGIYYNFTTDTTVMVTYRGSYYHSYDEYSGAVTIPDTVIYNGNIYHVTSIGEDAFHGCTGLTSVVIPNSVTSIGEAAFYYCSGLTSLVMGNSVTIIEDGAFSHCFGLTSVEIPNSVTHIRDWAFYECSGLTAVHIDDIAAWCRVNFGGPEANPLRLAHNLYLKGELVVDLVIPNSVTSIGYSAFSGCLGLTSVVIPNSVTSIDQSVFRGCSGLTSVEIPNSVTSIGYSAFSGCLGLTFVEIPNSVTNIGNYAFEDCKKLKFLYISSNIKSIGNQAFNGCKNLSEIRIGAEKVVPVHTNVFSEVTYGNACLYVPKGCKFAYEKTSPWNKFKKIAEMDFTDIDDVLTDKKCANVFYDFNGRVVTNPTKGIYIVNGKKVLVK